MRPELQRLIDELTQVRSSIDEVHDTSKIATNGWTVAQVLDHLTKIHTSLQPRFAEALASASPRTGEDSIRYSLLDRMMVKTMSGNSPIRLPVPPIFEPGNAGPEAKATCLSSIDALMAILRQADEKTLAGIKVSSPISDRIRLGLLPYLDATVQHAQYHRGQI